MKNYSDLTPFYDKVAKALKFNFRPLHDFAFIFPLVEKRFRKGAKTSSIIEIPAFALEEYVDDTGIVLAIGPGYYDKKNKFHSTASIKAGMLVAYDKRVPTAMLTKGLDGRQHRIVICGYQDMGAIVDD